MHSSLSPTHFKSVSSQTLKAHALGNSGARLAKSMPVDRQRASPRIRMRGQRVGRCALRRMEPAHFSPRCSVGLLHRLPKRLQVLARLICFPHIAGPKPVHSKRALAPPRPGGRTQARVPRTACAHKTKHGAQGGGRTERRRSPGRQGGGKGQRRRTERIGLHLYLVPRSPPALKQARGWLKQARGWLTKRGESLFVCSSQW